MRERGKKVSISRKEDKQGPYGKNREQYFAILMKKKWSVIKWERASDRYKSERRRNDSQRFQRNALSARIGGGGK